MSPQWQLVESTAESSEEDFFAAVARALVELTGARAVVLVMAQGDDAKVLARHPAQPGADTSFSLKGSPFEELPVALGMFRTSVPAVLCGIPTAAGTGSLLCASAEAGPERRIIVGVVVDDEVLDRAPSRALLPFAVRTAARVLGAAERDNERRMLRYRRVADAIGEVVWEAHFPTGKIDWSGPMRERFRYADLGASADMDWWKSRIHPDDRARVGESFAAACAGADASWAGVYRFLRGDGTVAHVRDRCFITRDADGRAVQATGSLHDISELHDLEQRLAMADRMASIGTLAAGLAHEINNPLTYVLGNLDMVLTGLDAGTCELSEQDVVQMLREAHQGALRVAEIVRSMRVFVRSEPAASKMADIDRVVESALAMAKNELRHRARVVKQLGNPPPARVNETVLVQVVLNLLMNAAQAIPEGQADRFEVGVTTGLDPKGRVFIEVHDTGEGMTPETMRRIFDPFFTTKEVGQGRGLGLSLVHTAVTASGGEIDVTSTRGEGSAFRVLLSPAGEVTGPSQSGVVPPARPRGRILVIDDEAPVVRVIRRMLVKDYDVVVAASGREALDLLHEDHDFDAVLCDVMMPDLTGADLHRQISAESPSIAERFVFVTGGAFGEHARAYVQSTTQPTITKPFRTADVVQAIELVRGRRGNSERARHAG